MMSDEIPVIDMSKGSLDQIALRIAEQIGNNEIEFKLQFQDNWNAETFCSTGKLPVLEQPPAFVLTTLLNNLEHCYYIAYQKNSDYAFLIPYQIVKNRE